MTNNDIKKGLECCGRENCRGCPYRGNCHQGNPMIRDALDYINRLEAENERLNRELDIANNDLAEECFGKAKTAKEIKAEAYKEFADLSIKRICEEVSAPTPSESYIVEKCNQTIDNLYKELVGNNNV